MPGSEDRPSSLFTSDDRTLRCLDLPLQLLRVPDHNSQRSVHSKSVVSHEGRRGERCRKLKCCVALVAPGRAIWRTAETRIRALAHLHCRQGPYKPFPVLEMTRLPHERTRAVPAARSAADRAYTPNSQSRSTRRTPHRSSG